MEQEEVKKALVKAYQLHYGNVTEACKAVNIGRTTFYRWIEDDPELKQFLHSLDVAQLKKDFIENALMKKIGEGDTACIIFANKSLNKDRGYIERNEVILSSSEPIEVELKIT